jgi:ABC-type methionine transport system ATPase subunit
METSLGILILLSFVNGAFAVAFVYYAYQIHSVKSQYEDMLLKQTSLQNKQSIENALLREKGHEMEELLRDIQTNMEKDSYENLSKINDKLKALELITENHAKSHQLSQSFEKKVMEQFSAIAQWRKKLGEDPTLIRGY